MPSKVPVPQWVPHMFVMDMSRINGEHGDPSWNWPSMAWLMVLAIRKQAGERYAAPSATSGPELSYSADGSPQLVCIYGTRELELMNEPQGWLGFSVQGELWFGGNRTEN